MSDCNQDQAPCEFYKYGIMEMIHELGNIAQKMICLAYEIDSNSGGTLKLNHKINLMTQMVKVYTGIYTNSTYSFQDIIEMIQIFHNCPIHLSGNYEELNENDPRFVNLKRILLLYSMWISKRYEFEIDIIDNDNARLCIMSEESVKAEQIYSLQQESIYGNILRAFAEHGFKCKMSGSQIELSTSNFDTKSGSQRNERRTG